jgi:ribosomal protein L11 methyltransferase
MRDESLRTWYALHVTFEAEAREAVEYALMEAGALGTESLDGNGEQFESIAYFDQTPDDNRVREFLAESLRIYGLQSNAVRNVQTKQVADRDWLGEWKKSWQPSTIGRFIIAPPWSDVKQTPDQIVVRIEPGMAFGTGTHETTRLCLAAIEKYRESKSFLDVGTGTGILAIAAAMLSPTVRVEAIDIDPDAIAIAHENARLNNVPDRIEFRTGTIGDTSASANLVCANLTANVIVKIMPQLLDSTCGRLVLSGILQAQSEMVLECLRELGINEFDIESDGEWIAIVV